MRLRALLFATSLVAACDPLAADDAVVEVVASRSADAVFAKTNLARLGEVFAGEPALAAMTVDEARGRAVDLLENRLRLLDLLRCAPEITADREAGTLDMSASGCRVGLLRLDGEMHASVTIETATCPTGECPSAVVWTIEELDLEIGAGQRRPHVTGSMTLRDPVDPDLPMTWTTGDDFLLVNRLGSFTTRSKAAWRTDAEHCVVGMQLEARMDRVGNEDDPDADLDPKVGTIVVSAQGVDRCPAKCPTAGEVVLSFGRGRVLQWDYDGKTIDVVGPRGAHSRTTLTCNE